MHVYTLSIDVYSIDVCTDAFMHITAYHTHNMGLFSIIATRTPSCCLRGLGVDWPEPGDDANAAVDPKYSVLLLLGTNGSKQIWVNLITTSLLPSPGIIGLIREIIPKWPSFRLVNYYNLPRHKSIEATSWQTASCEVV